MGRLEALQNTSCARCWRGRWEIQRGGSKNVERNWSCEQAPWDGCGSQLRPCCPFGEPSPYHSASQTISNPSKKWSKFQKIILKLMTLHKHALFLLFRRWQVCFKMSGKACSSCQETGFQLHFFFFFLLDLKD